MIMNTLNEIEQAIRQLSSEELAAFRVWFAEFNDLESQGIDKEQAHILRSGLATFSDDWDSPEMSIYDNYDAAKDSVNSFRFISTLSNSCCSCCLC